MVDLPLGIDVLSRTHHHTVGRGHVDQWGFAWVCMRHPQRDREAVGRAAEENRDGA